MMQDFLVVSAIMSWITILLTLSLNLVLVRRINGIAQPNSQAVQVDILSTEQTDVLSIGTIAPSFIAQTLDGHEIISAGYAGKISVFTFVSNLCASCHELIKGLDEIAPEVEELDINLVFVGVNSLEDMQEFVAATNTRFSCISAPRTSNSFASEFKVWSTPTTYVIDRDGKIKWVGTVSANTMNQLLKEWVG